MVIMRSSTDLDTRKVYSLSEKIFQSSETLMKVINFIQLNGLALKQILRNVDSETRAFESELFKNFFKDFYNQKDSQMKHLLEHPGALRAYAQVAYFIRTISDNLPYTSMDRIQKFARRDEAEGGAGNIKDNSFFVSKYLFQSRSDLTGNTSSKAHSNMNLQMNGNGYANGHVNGHTNGYSNGKSNDSSTQQNNIFTNGNADMEVNGHNKDVANVEEVRLKQFATEVDEQAFGVVDMNMKEEEMWAQIELNLVNAERNIMLQENFFVQHQNLMLNELGLKVTKYDSQMMRSRAHDYYADQTLEKDAYISIALNYEGEKQAEKACYSMIDLYLVYTHTFFYITNYYGLGQTSPDYTKSLDLPPSLSGILQAATPVAAIFWGFFINVITKTKYRYPYILCLSMLIIGNLFYYLAETFKDNKSTALALLILGRMIFGMGGSRLMTRKYIAINVPFNFQSKYSTYLVGFSSLGITLGPGISSMLEFVKPTTVAGTSLTTFNILALFFFFIWVFVFILFLFLFKGHDKSIEKQIHIMKKNEEELSQRFKDLHKLYSNLEDRKLKKNLSMIQKSQQNFICSGLEVRENKNYNPSQSFVPIEPKDYIRKKETRSIFKVFFPNNITFFSLWCFLIFKTIKEALFTETPQMTDEFYGWSSQDVGWFILALTIIGVPTTLLTYWANKRTEDRKILVVGFVLYLVGCILKINYRFDQPQNVYHYCIASSILFCGTLVGEAAAIAILAKVISPSLKMGFLNAGLLAGTADTLGRTIGNSSMTLFSSFR